MGWYNYDYGDTFAVLPAAADLVASRLSRPLFRERLSSAGGMAASLADTPTLESVPSSRPIFGASARLRASQRLNHRVSTRAASAALTGTESKSWLTRVGGRRPSQRNLVLRRGMFAGCFANLDLARLPTVDGKSLERGQHDETKADHSGIRGRLGRDHVCAFLLNTGRALGPVTS